MTFIASFWVRWPEMPCICTTVWLWLQMCGRHKLEQILLNMSNMPSMVPHSCLSFYSWYDRILYMGNMYPSTIRLKDNYGHFQNELYFQKSIQIPKSSHISPYQPATWISFFICVVLICCCPEVTLKTSAKPLHSHFQGNVNLTESFLFFSFDSSFPLTTMEVTDI